MQFIKEMEDFTVEDLIEMLQEVNNCDSRLDFIKVYENDAEFFEMFFHDSAYELAQKISYGVYDFNDQYVRFDGYGNIESLSDYEYEKEIEGYRDEILDAYKELVEENAINDWLEYLEEDDY